MSKTYDAIVVGARCAGAPTAMLLARKGYRVLLVDRALFPSDTVSTHVMHPRASAALARWGVLDRVVASGCPPITTYTFDFGPFTLSGSPGTPDLPPAYCPRRTLLDKILVDAAEEAGADVRPGFSVERVLMEGDRVVGIKGHGRDGRSITESANVVVGADGRSSRVAEAVQAGRYEERPPLLAPYYAYWSGLPTDGRFETYIRPNSGFAAAPTNDGLTMVVGGWPYAEFAEKKADYEKHYLALFDQVPAFAARIRNARLESRIAGLPTTNYFRKPYGPGWALVGDAGYLKDPITAQGILDAFRDAEACASALDLALRGARIFDGAMADYQRDRDLAVRSMYDFTCQLATLAPPPPELQQLFAAIAGNPPAMDAFVRMNAGTISPAQFMAPDHVQSMLAGTRAAA
jgi:2-polyprenyl-6-methoxyphenol hydroxylase-like FAD-dependent oxidoreductase